MPAPDSFCSNKTSDRSLRFLWFTRFVHSCFSTGRRILFPWKQKYAGVHRARRRVLGVQGFQTWWSVRPMNVFTLVCVRESVVCECGISVYIYVSSCTQQWLPFSVRTRLVCAFSVVFVFRLPFRVRVRVCRHTPVCTSAPVNVCEYACILFDGSKASSLFQQVTPMG